MKHIRKLFESVPLENHKTIISEIKELDFILKDENCIVRYYNPGWSYDGFWIEVITYEKVDNYREGYTVGDLNRDFKNLYLSYISEWSDRVKELCNSSRYLFDVVFGTRARRNENGKYWTYYFKIRKP